jgi:hypothetical protein
MSLITTADVNAEGCRRNLRDFIKKRAPAKKIAEANSKIIERQK